MTGGLRLVVAGDRGFARIKPDIHPHYLPDGETLRCEFTRGAPEAENYSTSNRQTGDDISDALGIVPESRRTSG
jgi:hypothetical protein